MTTAIFHADVAINVLLLLGVIWSIACPARRIWPPPGKGTWQQVVTWALWLVACGLNVALVVLDWGRWVLPLELRVFIGAPLVLLGTLLVTWGIGTLGSANTSGVSRGFVRSGPYRFTRNPQYLGDIVLFLGIALVANSLQVAVVHLLMALVFLCTPLAEEPWLEQEYGEVYRAYQREVPRFL